MYSLSKASNVLFTYTSFPVLLTLHMYEHVHRLSSSPRGIKERIQRRSMHITNTVYTSVRAFLIFIYESFFYNKANLHSEKTCTPLSVWSQVHVITKST